MESRTLSLDQPSAWRREWRLSDGDRALATLRVPVFRSGARAEVGGRSLLIERRGALGGGWVVLDEGTGEELASLQRKGLHRRLQLGERTGEWRRLGLTKGSGFVDEDGEPFLSARVRGGLVRSSGEVEVSDALEAPDAVVAALLATYLLIRRNEEESAASTSVVASSGAWSS